MPAVPLVVDTYNIDTHGHVPMSRCEPPKEYRAQFSKRSDFWAPGLTWMPYYAGLKAQSYASLGSR